MWRLCRPLRPLFRLLRLLPPIPLRLLAPFRSPLWFQSPLPTPTSPSPIFSTRRFCLHSPPVLSCPRGTSSLRRCHVFLPAGITSLFSSLSSPSLSSLSPLLSPLLSLPCCASPLVHPWFSSLLSYPHLRRPLGSFIHLCRPSRLLPRPRPPISPARTKLSAEGEAGVRHAGRMWVGLHCAGSALSGPSPCWGTASTSPILTLAPTVAPRALSAGILALACHGRQARGGSG